MPVKRLLFLLAIAGRLALGQAPVPTLNGLAGFYNYTTSVSGANVGLTPTWTCKSGDTCTGSIDQGVGAVTSGTLYTLNPVATITYTLQVQDVNYGAYEATLTVFVSANAVSVVQSTLPQNNGPGCQNGMPAYGVCEITWTYAAAGCGLAFYGNGSLTQCTGGTVANPFESVQIYLTFTGPSSQTQVIGGYYVGGAPANSGNQWAARALLTAPGTWTYTGYFGNGGTNPGYAVVSGTVTVAANPTAKGWLQINPAYSYILQTSADGNAFYPFMFNAGTGVGDSGNFSVILGPRPGDAGGSYSPPLGANLANAGPAYWEAYTSVGFNMGRMAFVTAANNLIYQLGVNNNLYFSGNFQGNPLYSLGSLTLDALYRSGKAAGLHVWALPQNEPYLFIPGGNVFTSAAVNGEYLRAWKYIVNRWSPYVDVWEIGNEIGSNSIPFNATMANFIATQDPYQHLTTISLTSGTNCPSIAALGGLSFCGAHHYDGYGVGPTRTLIGDLAGIIATEKTLMPATLDINGEAGQATANTSDAPWNEDFRIWTNVSFFNQGSVSLWPQDACVTGQGGGGGICMGQAQEYQMALFSSFANSIDPGAVPITLTINSAVCGSCTLTPYALGSATDIAAWIGNSTTGNHTAVTGGTVSIPFPAINMFGEFISPSTGKILSTFSGPGTIGTAAVALPGFCNTTFGPATTDCDVWLRVRANNPSVPVVMTNAMPVAMISTAYVSTGVTLSAQGGAGAPFTWKVTAGALPPGITLSAGVVSGTPTMAGNFSFSLVATDTSGQPSVAQALILCVAPAIASGFAQTSNMVQSISQTLYLTYVGGIPPIYFTTGPTGTPAGPTFNTTGGYSGAPTVNGTFPIAGTLTDSAGNTGTFATTMNVLPSSNVIGMRNSVAPQGTVNSYYRWGPITAQGGTAPYTYTLSGCTVPAGLTVVSTGNNTSYIEGVPASAGSTGCTLNIADVASHAASESITFVFNAAPVLTTATLPAYTPGVTYAPQAMAVTGGTQPITCGTTSPLPPGFVFDSLIGLYGTTQGTAAYSLNVQCFDNLGAATATVALSLGSSVAGGQPPSGVF